MNGEKKPMQGGIVVQKKHLVIAAILVVLLLVGAVAWGMSRNRAEDRPGSSDTNRPGSLELDPDAQDWQGNQPPDAGGANKGIKIPGYPSIALPADTETVKVALLNPEGNPCYFRFELTLKDTGEVLYASKLVPPGQAVYEITLSRPLTAGEYDAVIRISTTSLQDQTPMNGANVETRLVVK